jgi:hypothetical protein
MFKEIPHKLLRIFEYMQLGHLLENNETLRDEHKGETANIFATGVSLLDIDLTKYNDSLTLSCNNIFLHPDFSDFNLDYYVAGVPYRRWRQLSPRFTHKDHHKFFANVNSYFSEKDTVHLYNATMQKYLHDRNFLKDKDVYYFLRKGSLQEANEQHIDYRFPITFADGALSLMIALAIFMGCKVINLFGCGFTYMPPQAFHFYDCLLLSKNFPNEQLEEIISDFGVTHPETDIRLLDYKIRPLNPEKLLVDFSIPHGLEESDVENDIYSIHRHIKAFTDAQSVKIINHVPDGYKSHIY